MTDYPLDIIIPLWNRPIEVRAALASFVTGSPLARLVMVNNGSERETESILEEFAEVLDDRALLVATRRNVGSVAAVNLGLSKSTAPFLLVTNPFTRLEQGWLDPVRAHFEHHPETGSVVLKKRGAAALNATIEVDCGSFDAMVMRRALYDAVGGFDEGMDGGEWALRDFARRSLACGFTTVAFQSRHLTVSEYIEFGSAARREERMRLASRTYTERWGDSQTFLLVCADSPSEADSGSLKVSLLASARQGNRIIAVAGSRVAKLFIDEGFSALHGNITFLPLPRFFSEKALRRIAENSLKTDPATILISDTDFIPIGMQRITVADFQEVLQQKTERYYKRGVHD